MQKISGILLALVIPNWVYAHVYVGVGTGREFADFNQDATIVNPFSNVKDNTHLAGSGAFGSIFAGYDGIYQHFYLAGEINLDTSSVAFRSSNNEFINNTLSATHFRIQNSYGISVLPGYALNNYTLLIYSRLGYANGSLKISTTNTSLANVNPRISGFRYGIGIKQSFTDHISARIEYNNVNYQNTSFTVLTGNTTKNTIISPTVGQVEFGLIYSFS